MCVALHATSKTEANILVLHVVYRAAPEHAYPAFVHDAVDFLALIFSGGHGLQETIGERVDVSRVAVGGVSAGGQLAAVACLKVAEAGTGARTATQPKPKLQMLFVPVIDSTAAVDGLWKTTRHSPWLTPERMMWYVSGTEPLSLLTTQEMGARGVGHL